MNPILPIALFVTLSGSAWADGTIIGTTSVTMSGDQTILPPPGRIPGTDMPDTPFFREVARERQHVESGAPMPVCRILTCTCPAGWSYVANPGHCEVPSAHPEVMSVPPAPPVSGDTPLMLKSGPLSSIFQTPCCVNFQTKAGTITMDLDNGTVDLHGAKLTDAARAFWDAVAQVSGHPAVKQRAYTLGDIDRMRAAVVVVMTAEYQAYIIQKTGLTTIVSHPVNSDVEDRLRTYMAAGITPEELEATVK